MQAKSRSRIENFAELVCGLVQTISHDSKRYAGDRFGKVVSKATKEYLRVHEFGDADDGLKLCFCLSISSSIASDDEFPSVIREAIFDYCEAQRSSSGEKLEGLVGQLVYDGFQFKEDDLLKFWGWDEKGSAIGLVVLPFRDLVGMAIPIHDYSIELNELADGICYSDEKSSVAVEGCSLSEDCRGKAGIVPSLVSWSRREDTSSTNIRRVVGGYGVGKSRSLLCYVASAFAVHEELRLPIYLELRKTDIRVDELKHLLHGDTKTRTTDEPITFWEELERDEPKSILVLQSGERSEISCSTRRDLLLDIVERWAQTPPAEHNAFIRTKKEILKRSKQIADALYLLVTRGYATLVFDNFELTNNAHMTARTLCWIDSIFQFNPMSRIVIGVRDELLAVGRCFDPGFRWFEQNISEASTKSTRINAKSLRLKSLLSADEERSRSHMESYARLHWPQLIGLDESKTLIDQLKALTALPAFFEPMRKRVQKIADEIAAIKNEENRKGPTPFETLGFYVLTKLFSLEPTDNSLENQFDVLLDRLRVGHWEPLMEASAIAFVAELAGGLSIGARPVHEARQGYYRLPSLRHSGIRNLEGSSENEKKSREVQAVLNFFLTFDRFEKTACGEEFPVFVFKERVLQEYLIGIWIGHTVLELLTRQNKGERIPHEIFSDKSHIVLAKYIGVVPITRLSAHCAAMLISTACRRLNLTADFDGIRRFYPRLEIPLPNDECMTDLSSLICKSAKFSFDKHREGNLSKLDEALRSCEGKVDLSDEFHARINPDHSDARHFKWMPHEKHGWAMPLDKSDLGMDGTLVDRMAIVAPGSRTWIGSPVILADKGRSLRILLSFEGLIDNEGEAVDILVDIDCHESISRNISILNSGAFRGAKVISRNSRDRIERIQNFFKVGIDKDDCNAQEVKLRRRSSKQWNVTFPSGRFTEFELTICQPRRDKIAGKLCFGGSEFIFSNVSESAVGAVDETPAHSVRVSPFLMDQMPVTNAEFSVFLRSDRGKEWGLSRRNVQEVRDKFENPYYMHLWDFDLAERFANSTAMGSVTKRAFLRKSPKTRWTALSQGIDWLKSISRAPESSPFHPHELRWLLQPVVYVNFYAAVSYASWCQKRLPTEAEWEVAARGGLTGQIFPWGGFADPRPKKLPRSFAQWQSAFAKCSAWGISDWESSFAISLDLRSRSSKQRFRHWEPFGEFSGAAGTFEPEGYFYTMREAAKGFGLFHLVGGVREWTLDLYDPNAYAWRNSIAPMLRYSDDPLNLSLGPQISINQFESTSFVHRDIPRVLRGGSFATEAGRLRCAHRDPLLPGNVNPDAGFRCVVDVSS